MTRTIEVPEAEWERLQAENRKLRDVLQWTNDQCPGKCAAVCDAALQVPPNALAEELVLLRSEHQEQARLLGMGSEREARLMAQLEEARRELQRMTIKNDALMDRLTQIEQANVDRWKEGYAAAERQIAAWLDQPCGMSGHDDRWCPACSFRADIANAIRDGQHRAMHREKP